MPEDDRQAYLAYMLRLWRAEDDNGPVWRASVESPHTGERQVFSSVELLIAFLREKTGGEWEEREMRSPTIRDRRR